MKGFRFITLAAAVVVAGCTVHQTEAPTLTGPSTLALSVSVTTSPQSITQNGSDASVVTARVLFTDPTTGQTAPKANLPIRFDMQVGGVAQDFGTLSARSAVTDSNGMARTTYTAPTMPIGGNSGTCNGVPGTCVTILAAVSDSTGANASINGSQQPGAATILLMPPDVIQPPSYTPKAVFAITPSANLTAPATVSFDASASCATDATGACSSTGSIVSYSWSFGDGGTGSGKTISYTYKTAGNFLATLTVTSDRGLSASTSQTITVALPTGPKAAFVFSPSAPAPTNTVFFDAATSTAAIGHNIVNYSWNFGDPNSTPSNPNTAQGVTSSHSFSLAGAYNVVLVVTDDTGQTNAVSTTVTVK